MGDILVVSEYMCHVYVRGDSLAAVLISDHEYPKRVSFTLLNKVSHLNVQLNEG